MERAELVQLGWRENLYLLLLQAEGWMRELSLLGVTVLAVTRCLLYMVQQHNYLLTTGQRENKQGGRCLCSLGLSVALCSTACALCQSWVLTVCDTPMEKLIDVWICNQSTSELEIFLDYQE